MLNFDPTGIAAALQTMEQQRRYADEQARQRYLAWLQEEQLRQQRQIADREFYSQFAPAEVVQRLFGGSAATAPQAGPSIQVPQLSLSPTAPGPVVQLPQPAEAQPTTTPLVPWNAVSELANAFKPPVEVPKIRVAYRDVTGKEPPPGQAEYVDLTPEQFAAAGLGYQRTATAGYNEARTQQVQKTVKWFDAQAAADLDLKLAQKNYTEAQRDKVLSDIDNAKRQVDAYVTVAMSQAARNDWEVEQGRALLGPNIDRILAEIANINADTATDEATRQARVQNLQAQTKALLAGAGVDEATAQKILAVLPWEIGRIQAETGQAQAATTATTKATESKYQTYDTSAFEQDLPGITGALGPQATMEKILDFANLRGKAADIAERYFNIRKGEAALAAEEPVPIGELIPGAPEALAAIKISRKAFEQNPNPIFDLVYGGITTAKDARAAGIRLPDTIPDDAPISMENIGQWGQAVLTGEKTETEQLTQEALRENIDFLRATYEDRLAKAKADRQAAEERVKLLNTDLQQAQYDLALAKKLGPAKEKEAQARVDELKARINESYARINQINQYTRESQTRVKNIEQDTKLIAERVKQLQAEGALPAGITQADAMNALLKVFAEEAGAAARVYKILDFNTWFNEKGAAVLGNLFSVGGGTSPQGAPTLPPSTNPIAGPVGTIFGKAGTVDQAAAMSEANGLVKKYGSAQKALQAVESTPMETWEAAGYSREFVEQVKQILRAQG